MINPRLVEAMRESTDEELVLALMHRASMSSLALKDGRVRVQVYLGKKGRMSKAGVESKAAGRRRSKRPDDRYEDPHGVER